MTAAYVDDSPVIDTVEAAPSASDFLKLVLNKLGYSQPKSKAFPPASHRTLLGASLSFDDVAEHGVARHPPTQNTHLTIHDGLETALRTKRCPPAAAGKLRWQMGWAATLTFGRMGRLGTQKLKQR